MIGLTPDKIGRRAVTAGQKGINIVNMSILVINGQPLMMEVETKKFEMSMSDSPAEIIMAVFNAVGKPLAPEKLHELLKGMG